MVIPAAVREALRAHSQAEAPNEACGLIVIEDGVAVRYEPGVNAAASPYRFDLRPRDPATLYLVDEGYEVAIFHSHLSSPAVPSRTDVELSVDYDGWPYVIYSLARDELAAFRITGRRVEELPIDG